MASVWNHEPPEWWTMWERLIDENYVSDWRRKKKKTKSIRKVISLVWPSQGLMQGEGITKQHSLLWFFFHWEFFGVPIPVSYRDWRSPRLIPSKQVHCLSHAPEPPRRWWRPHFLILTLIFEDSTDHKAPDIITVSHKHLTPNCGTPFPIISIQLLSQFLVETTKSGFLGFSPTGCLNKQFICIK